jgi:hypothetical protein
MTTPPLPYEVPEGGGEPEVKAWPCHRPLHLSPGLQLSLTGLAQDVIIPVGDASSFRKPVCPGLQKSPADGDSHGWEGHTVGCQFQTLGGGGLSEAQSFPLAGG